jgi:hypothetical protein
MIPFIWLGNAVLVISFRKIQFKRIWIKIVSCSFLKSALLFFSALVLFKLGIVPVMFLTAMGIIQLITALCGGILAFGVNKLRSSLI